MSELSPAAQAAADTFRALCAELTAWAEKTSAHYFQPPDVLLRARAALADGPAVPQGREPASVTGQPSDEDLLGIACQSIEPYDKIRPGEYESETECAIEVYGSELVTFARAVLTRWGNPAPQPPAEGEVAEFITQIKSYAEYGTPIRLIPFVVKRAADLLERLSPPQPVPVSVSDALIKAECALSDIAEGEPMADGGDPLKWAERRCADTLAIIRPTMMQHKIRTSEWPPVAAHALPLPEMDE